MTVKPTRPMGTPRPADRLPSLYRHVSPEGVMQPYVWRAESPNVGPNRAMRRSK